MNATFLISFWNVNYWSVLWHSPRGEVDWPHAAKASPNGHVFEYEPDKSLLLYLLPSAGFTWAQGMEKYRLG
jgi:hypothetical protein